MLNPVLKKALSAVMVAVLGAALVAIQQKLVPLAPEAFQATLVAALAGIAHYLDAWGHAERVDAAVAKATGSVPPPPKPPTFPPLAAACIGLLCTIALIGCSLFGSGGAAWPIVKSCLPSKGDLVVQVEAVLMGGGDYEATLLQIAGKDGKDAVVCAVKAALAELAGKVSASPERAQARARGVTFLKKTGNES